MSIQRAKGKEASCCCGGCNSSPSDPRRSRGTVELNTSNARIKTLCCRCIPDYICINLSASGQSTQDIVVPRLCDYSSTYEGDAIQYSENSLWIDDSEHTINIRLLTSTGIGDSGCYIGYDIPSLDLSGQTLINHNILYSGEECDYGMRTAQCVEFTGGWDFSYNSVDYSLFFSPTDTISLKDKICCNGCDCICRCMCFSIWEWGDNLVTLLATNDLVCATGTEPTPLEYCSGSYTTFGRCNSYSWAHPSGFNISIDGDAQYGTLSDYSICYGDEQSLTCECANGSGWATLDAVRSSILLGGDNYYHIINSGSQEDSLCYPYSPYASGDPVIDVIYDFNMNEETYDNKVASYFTWLGRTHNENSTTIFSAWDYVDSEWDTIFTRTTGRASGVEYPRAIRSSLESIYTGTSGADKGHVKIRLQSTNSNSLYTDLLRLTPTQTCCLMKLEIPEISGFNYVPDSILPKTLSSQGENACPSPDPTWYIDSTGGGTVAQVVVSANCAWCNEKCSSVSVNCCDRPLSKILFAEVNIGCYNCGGTPCTIPIIADTVAEFWEMPTSPLDCCSEESVSRCTLTCGASGQFSLNLEVNACTMNVVASSVSCDPLNIVFNGTLGGGISCCGGETSVFPDVTVTIVE